MARTALEFSDCFWAITNLTRGANATPYLPLLPEETLRHDWLDLLASAQAPVNLLLQDVPLGVVALLAFRKGVHTSEKLFHPLMSMRNLSILRAVASYALKTVVGLCLMLVFLPLALPVLCAFWMTSCLVRTLYSLKFGASVTKAQGMDSVWGVESKESRPFITTSLLLSGFPCLERIHRHIHSKILDVRDEKGDFRYKKFRQVFSQRYGYYSWRDAEDFDIQNHVRVIDLRAPPRHPKAQEEEGDVRPEQVAVNMVTNSCGAEPTGRQGEADDLVNQFLSDEGTTALSADRPPWEVLLLVRQDNRYNLVMRLHHAIGDGVTLMRLCLEALVDNPSSFPTVGLRPVNIFVKVAMMVWSALVLPLGLLQVVANFDHNALHGHLLSGRKVMTWSRELPLAVIKQVKTAANATVNDVLMSCLAAALSKHFARRSEEVGHVTAVVPVSFHDLQAPMTLTNRFSVATLKLPSARALTPTSRLTATKTVLERMKKDPTLGAVFWVVRAVSQVLPAPVAECLLTGRGVTVAASNVPGPQQEITIWGDTVEEMLFWVPNRAPVGVGVSFASYMGNVRIGLNVDAALVHSREEAQTLLKDMEEELERLQQHLVLGHQ